MSKAKKVSVGEDALNRDYPNSPAPHERMVDFKKRTARRGQVGARVDNVRAGDPTPERVDKSSRGARDNGRSVRLGAELPKAIRQLLSKGVLTRQEGRIIARFRGDWDLAYYSTPGMTSRYGERVGGGGNGDVVMARALVTDARDRMTDAKGCMTEGCWDVLCKMTVFDITQVEVGGITHQRYKDVKARRYAAGILLIEAVGALRKIYD